MTATELRALNANVRIAFVIGQDEISPDELIHFTNDELDSFYWLTDREDLVFKILDIEAERKKHN